MTMFQPGYVGYSQGFGSVPAGVNFPFYGTVAPTSTNVQGNFGVFQLGQIWVVAGLGAWILIGLSSAGGTLSATWEQIVSATGDVLSVTGTANQVTATPTTGNVVVSLPSAIVTPGSLSTTTALVSGSTITAATSITATAGNITATNGNVVLGTAGNKIVSTSTGTNLTAGANAFGTFTFTTGTFTNTVATTAVTANSLIFLQVQTLGTVTVPQSYAVASKATGTSFTVQSTSSADTSVIDWFIIN